MGETILEVLLGHGTSASHVKHIEFVDDVEVGLESQFYFGGFNFALSKDDVFEALYEFV